MTYYKNITYYLELTLLDNQGNHVPGQVVTYNIYKSSDDTLFESGTLSEIGITGVYKDSVIYTDSIQYRVEYTTPSKYDDLIETVSVEEFSPTDTHDLIKRILGLCQENYRIINPTYDKSGNLLNGIIKTYPSANDVDNDTNPIAIYNIQTTYGNGKFRNNVTGFKVKKTG